MYMAYRFSPLVEGFKSLKCYHAGDGVCVEIDVLMKEETPLRKCHDIAETLQYCLEGLNEVYRAFVTMDCEYPNHREKGGCEHNANILQTLPKVLQATPAARSMHSSDSHSAPLMAGRIAYMAFSQYRTYLFCSHYYQRPSIRFFNIMINTTSRKPPVSLYVIAAFADSRYGLL